MHGLTQVLFETLVIAGYDQSSSGNTASYQADNRNTDEFSQAQGQGRQQRNQGANDDQSQGQGWNSDQGQQVPSGQGGPAGACEDSFLPSEFVRY